MDAETNLGPFHVEHITLMSTSLRLTVPPARVRDVHKLLALEASGFVPPHSIHFDPDEREFVLSLDGEAATHVLELLALAVEDREAETWSERQDRQRQQLGLQFGQDVTSR